MSRQRLSHDEWLSRFNRHLDDEGYANNTRKFYVPRVRKFLAFLERQRIDLSCVRPTHVERYCQHAPRKARPRRDVPNARWRSSTATPLHMLLRLAHGQWPPRPKPSTPAERFQCQLCRQYIQWMVDVRGLAPRTISECSKEANRFVRWLGTRASRAGIAALSVAEIDNYLKHRSSSQCRSSIQKVATQVRVFLRWLYSIGLTQRDLSTAVVSPSLYALESIPSALRAQDVSKVLAAVQQDDSAKGIRDYAILMLLSTYGIRAGEIAALRLDDIDWRKEIIRIRHSKTGATSYLPLLPQVGGAILKYLQKSRPKTTFREIFIRHRAPNRPFQGGQGLSHLTRARLQAVGVVSGKRGAHAFRHARAVSLLRAAVPLKEIGDILGHRSSRSTMTYIKLATDDLRAVALEIPAEVQA